MEMTPSEKQIVCMKFDSFIKKCCKNRLRNIAEHFRIIAKNEVPVADFLDFQFDNIGLELIPADFNIKGHKIVIDNLKLINALESLEARDRELILLLFFIGHKPEEISKERKVVLATIYNHKNRALQVLKKKMEEEDD